MKAYQAGARKVYTKLSSSVTPDRSEVAEPLPSGGLSRFRQIQPYLPVSRETWRLLVNARRAPQPLRLGERCTVWRNDDVKAWLADPVAFAVEG